MIIDITGKRIKKLTAVKRVKSSSWLCRCDCGNERVLRTGHFNSGKIKSCGCVIYLKSGKEIRKHGMSSSREHASYGNMLARCTNPNNKRYQDYAGKGIKVCERWLHSFANFIDDMGECPDGFQIDRIDNEKGYFLENCRWVSPKENMANRSNSKIFHMFGKEYNSSIEAAADLGISTGTVVHWCWLRKKKSGEFYDGKKDCWVTSVY